MKKAKSIILIIAVLVFSAMLMAAAKPETESALKPEDMYNEAVELMLSQDYENAAEKFEICGFYSDALSFASYCRAYSCVKSGEYEAAAVR